MEIPARRVSQAEGTDNAEAGMCPFGGNGVSRRERGGKK